MFGLGSIKSALWGAVASLIGLLSAALWWTNAARNRAQKAAEDAQDKARQEEAARNHVQETTEATREVEDDIRRDSAKIRREKLRDYASGESDDQESD